MKVKLSDLEEVSHWSNEMLYGPLFVHPDTADCWDEIID